MSKRPDDDHPDLGIEEPEPKWDDDDPIVAEQPSTWVYWNTRGQVVIRQRAEVFEDDPFVMFSIENLPALIAALRQKLAEWNTPGDHPEPQIEPKPAKQRALTAAERKRRSRQQRHDVTKSGHECHGNRDIGHENPDMPRDNRDIALPFPGENPR
jgi:hypothetical protein